jgi:hypothetical protein
VPVAQPKNRTADPEAHSTIESDSIVDEKRDVSSAKKAWKKDAPAQFKELLDAKPINEES